MRRDYSDVTALPGGRRYLGSSGNVQGKIHGKFASLKMLITAHIRNMMRRLCFQSFCPSVHRGREGSGQMHYLANVPGIEHFLAKKSSCLEKGGGAIIFNKQQQQIISLLTCGQKEVLKACTCSFSRAARHSAILPPPSSLREWALFGSFHIGHRSHGVPSEPSRFRIAFLLSLLFTLP